MWKIPTKSFSAEDLQRADVIIDWHSHPDRMGDLGKGDLEHIQEALKVFGDKDVYFVVYRPLNNTPYWYKAQPLQKK